MALEQRIRLFILLKTPLPGRDELPTPPRRVPRRSSAAQLLYREQAQPQDGSHCTDGAVDVQQGEQTAFVILHRVGTHIQGGGRAPAGHAVRKAEQNRTLAGGQPCAMDGLRTLGITDASDARKADFSGLFADDTGAYLAQALHGTKISVEEEGVEGAAYTVMMMEVLCAMPQEPERVDFHLDRPFLFAVTLDQGACLFLGVLANPAQA